MPYQPVAACPSRALRGLRPRQGEHSAPAVHKLLMFEHPPTGLVKLKELAKGTV